MCECLVNWMEFIISVKYEGSVLSWMKVLTEMVVVQGVFVTRIIVVMRGLGWMYIYTPSLQLGEGKRYFAG